MSSWMMNSHGYSRVMKFEIHKYSNIFFRTRIRLFANCKLLWKHYYRSDLIKGSFIQGSAEGFHIGVALRQSRFGAKENYETTVVVIS